MKGKTTTLAGALISLLLLAACGSSGGIGDILGGGNNNPSTQSDEIRGTVDFVDTNNRSILLTNVSGYQSMLSNSGGNTVRVYYDNNTPVEYQGRSHNVADLERGDEVAVRIDQNGNNIVARSVTVLRDVSGGSSTYPSSSASSVRGTVRNIDTSRRTIEINRDGYTNSVVTVQYDPQTYVTFNNRQYAVADLERGDEIDIRVRDLGSGRWLAQDITVLRSVSGTGTSGGIYGGNPSSNLSTIRGTVRHHDASRRTIEIDQTSWISGFDAGAGGSSLGTRVIQYPANMGIEVNGQMNSLSGLERGDVIEVQVSNTSGSTLYAERIFLARDVNAFR